jgi:hypothetical protein
MQVIKRLLYICCLSVPMAAFSQTTLLPQGNKHQPLMDRLEIRFRDSALSFQSVKPFDRKTWVGVLERLDSTANYSRVDAHNIQSALMNNAEWVTGSTASFISRKPVLKSFYKQKADFLQVAAKDFFLSVNPVVQFQLGKESGTTEKIFQNTKGARFRGLIAKKIGFDFYITDNQERPPYFVRNFEDSFRAVPGAGFYKSFKTTAYDYFDARGSMYFNVTKYINVQFGYDKNFIGDGYRSFFLSDFSNNYLFLKLNTKIWKLNYQNIFMELVPTEPVNNGSLLLDKKYAAMHHLSWQANRWLNVGLFESIIFGRRNHFDFSYLNPIIFLRSIEQQNGSRDNANVGFDLKANVAKRFQFYTQILLDEFKLSEIKSGNGWWGNKYAFQLGGKYIDAFGIKNLDLQGEYNTARPFTYSHYDSVSNYTHYNQPLAHPLGANFRELVGILRYQPHPKLTIVGKLIGWKQGLDSAGINFGSNVFRIYNSRPKEYGWSTGDGRVAKGLNASLYVGYELLENLYLDGSLLLRKYTVADDTRLTRNVSVFSIGLRMNVARREYDY